jgi:hypothetical protein
MKWSLAHAATPTRPMVLPEPRGREGMMEQLRGPVGSWWLARTGKLARAAATAVLVLAAWAPGASALGAARRHHRKPCAKDGLSQPAGKPTCKHHRRGKPTGSTAPVQPAAPPAAQPNITVLGSRTSSAAVITTAPTIANAIESHRSWREGNKLANSSRVAAPVGTTFSFTLNERASASFAFTQREGGRRVNGRCVSQTKSNRRMPGCTRTVTRATLSFAGHAGVNAVSFQGRTSRSRKLQLGAYTLVITASNAAHQHSSPRRLSFTIVK